MDSRIEEYVQRCKDDDRQLLTEAEAKDLLRSFDVPVVDETVVSDPDEAVAAAESLGYPVVLKGVSPDVPHKSEAGIIQLDLDSPEAIRDGYATITENFASEAPDARVDGVLVQPYTEGEETILGMDVDRQFGPVVLFGLGGIFVEIFEDVSLRLPPIDDETAMSMIEDLQGEDLLKGARGQSPRDVGALVDAITSFSEFVEAVDPYVAEVDLNPLIVHEAGDGVVAVDALVRLDDAVVS